jgi:hypothetical protein
LPKEPSAGVYYTIERRIENEVFEVWEKFMPGFRRLPTYDRVRSLSSA